MAKKGVLALILISLLATGCVGRAHLFSNYLPLSSEPESLRACLHLYQQINDELNNAGIPDSGQPLVKDLPFLRSSRFLASFAEKAVVSDKLYRDWLLALNQNAIIQAGLLQGKTIWEGNKQSRQNELLECGAKLVADLAQQGKWRELMVGRVSVPENYQSWKRVVGLYPLAAIPFKWGVIREQESIARQEKRYLKLLPDNSFEYFGFANYDTQQEELGTEKILPQLSTPLYQNALGIPVFTPLVKFSLLKKYAPVFAMPKQKNGSVAYYDSPGTPSATGFDISVPKIYSYIDLGRFQDQVTIRLNYSVWFSERPPRKNLDLLAGKLDSLVWRVHLLPDGRVLAWDTVHGCGCWYRIYPAENMVIRDSKKFFTEPVYTGQTMPARNSRKILYLASGTHHINAIRDLSEGINADNKISYTALEPYQNLITQQPPMFNQSGIVKRSKRAERWFFWPMGIESPGAMRAQGTQAIAFIGKRHFDDTFLLEEVGLYREKK